MKREIIAYKGYFKEFFDRLDTGTQDKILYVLMLLQTQDRIPLKFMKLIEEGLYELRITYRCPELMDRRHNGQRIPGDA